MTEVLIRESNFEKARKMIRENKDKKIVFIGDDEINRKILEKERINVLVIEEAKRKDRQKQRDSGLDNVMARLAKKNNIKIGILFDEILQSNGLEKARILGRIRQNIKLCNKSKTGMMFVFLNSEDKQNTYGLKALGLSLGMPTWMVKDL